MHLLHHVLIRGALGCGSNDSSLQALPYRTPSFQFPAVVYVSPLVGFLAFASRDRLVSVASLVATLGIARSPASSACQVSRFAGAHLHFLVRFACNPVLAVLRETGASGPFSSLVLSVTGKFSGLAADTLTRFPAFSVSKDVLTLILFSLNVEAVSAAEAPRNVVSRSGLALRSFALPVACLLLSAVLGSLGGVLLSTLLASRAGERLLLSVAVLVLAAGLFFVSISFHAEPLLVCVAAGALAANRPGERGDRQRADLLALLSFLLPAVNLGVSWPYLFSTYFSRHSRVP